MRCNAYLARASIRAIAVAFLINCLPVLGPIPHHVASREAARALPVPAEAIFRGVHVRDLVRTGGLEVVLPVVLAPPAEAIEKGSRESEAVKLRNSLSGVTTLNEAEDAESGYACRRRYNRGWQLVVGQGVRRPAVPLEAARVAGEATAVGEEAVEVVAAELAERVGQGETLEAEQGLRRPEEVLRGTEQWASGLARGVPPIVGRTNGVLAAAGRLRARGAQRVRQDRRVARRHPLVFTVLRSDAVGLPAPGWPLGAAAQDQAGIPTALDVTDVEPTLRTFARRRPVRGVFQCAAMSILSRKPPQPRWRGERNGVEARSSRRRQNQTPYAQ